MVGGSKVIVRGGGTSTFILNFLYQALHLQNQILHSCLKLSSPQIMILFCQLSKQQNNVVILVIVLRSFPLFSQMLIFYSVYIYIFSPLFLCCFLLCSSRACVCVRMLQRRSELMPSTPFRPLSCCCSLGFAECKPDYVAFL